MIANNRIVLRLILVYSLPFNTAMDDEGGVGAMHELNAIKEYHEVEQETGGVVLLVGWWDSLERVGRERQQIRLRVNMGI